MTGFIQAVIKNTRSIRMANKASGTVTTQNYLMDLTAGLAVNASASSTVATVAGICNQSIAAAEALTQVPLIEIDKNDIWLVDSTNNSDATHNGQKMVLGANAYTVNNTGTTDANGIVVQVGVFGATTDKKILVKFV